MKESFIDKNFGQAARDMITVINGILDDYAAQGYDLSLRQLYYQLVSRNLVPTPLKIQRKSPTAGRKATSAVSGGRLGSLMQWNRGNWPAWFETQSRASWM